MTTPSKQRWAIRRGIAAGLIVLAVLTPGIVVRSSTPVLTLAELLVAGILTGLAVGAIAVAVTRHRARPLGASDGPRLHARGAALLGLAVGILIDAGVAADSMDPLSTFVADVVFVLWVALLVCGLVLLIERRRFAGHTVA